MEKLQYRPPIAAQRDRGMVSSRGHTLGMESIWNEFPSVDPWQTSVSAQPHLLCHTDAEGFTFLAGAGKSVLWYANSLSGYLCLENLQCLPVPQSSRRSKPCVNLATHHWQYITM